MSRELENKLKEQGWVKVRCRVEINNGSSQSEYLGWDDRLISPGGNATYNTATDVLRNYSSNESVTIITR